MRREPPERRALALTALSASVLAGYVPLAHLVLVPFHPAAATLIQAALLSGGKDLDSAKAKLQS